MHTFVYFDFLITRDSNEDFAQEESRKINEKRGCLFMRVGSIIGRNFRIFKELQTDSRSFLDEVRVLQG